MGPDYQREGDSGGSRSEQEAPESTRDEATTEAPRPDPAQLEEQLRWARADLDNLRKRFDREVERARWIERAEVLSAWLPVIDNLELALEHVGSAPQAPLDAMVAGVSAVRDQALAVLHSFGVEPHGSIGEPFDPRLHEAVAATSDGVANTVAHVVRRGYGTGSEVLRPAQVVVARDRENPSGKDLTR